jgi:4-hydroxy-3-methylbut-2-enyl diphosphate reductase IspH
MTREEIIHNMQAIEQMLEQRVEVWRDIVEMDGTISQRIYRGSFSVSPREAIRDVGHDQAADDTADRELNAAKAKRARRAVPVAV